MPFITTFNPTLPCIFNVIKKNHSNLLLSSDRCKNTFLHLPVVAFRRSLNLRYLLVTANVSPNTNHSSSALPSSSLPTLRHLSLVSRAGAVVRALASHQCGPGSIPRLGVICGLSLLVLYSAPRGFLRVLRFPLSSKTNI